jgi:CubicO group peptidase (beta-lactamase class C family)
MKQRLLLLLTAFCLPALRAQSPYFPPLAGSEWATLSPAALGWCPDKIDSLYRFLEQRNTRAFLVLKDGKIVLEKYFGATNAGSTWYWASAGKTLTAFLVGKAQEEGYLTLSDNTSDYLGKGWTASPPDKEARITVRNQMTMTSGLDDKVPDPDCTLDTCLRYYTDPGTRWAYHNAPYTLLDKVLQKATGRDLNAYTNQKIKSKTGMTGTWLPVDYNNVYFSNARSMARFGLLIQNRGIWNKDTLLRDAAFFKQMLEPTQGINQSYGYLWWLNGKNFYMLPGLEIFFPGAIAPAAPADMVAALGRNGQILNVVPSKGLVVLRMGDAPGGGGIAEVPNVFCNDIWKRLNAAMCASTPLNETAGQQARMYYRPESRILAVEFENEPGQFSVELYDAMGRRVLQTFNERQTDLAGLNDGIFFAVLRTGGRAWHKKVFRF